MQHFVIMQTCTGVVIAKSSSLSANLHLLKKNRYCTSLTGRVFLLPAQGRLAWMQAFSRMNKLECCKLFYQNERPSYLVKNHYCRAYHLQPHITGFLSHCPSPLRWAEAWCCTINPSSPFQRRASKDRGDLRQRTMESIANTVSTGRGEGRTGRQPGWFVCKLPCFLQGQKRSTDFCPPREEKCYALGWLLPRNLNQCSAMFDLTYWNSQANKC